MKVIIEQKAGEDYPQNCKGNKAFFEAQKRSIRQRLQLRENDVVEIRDVTDDPNVVNGIRIRNPNATKEDPCFKCLDKNTERCNTNQCKV